MPGKKTNTTERRIEERNLSAVKGLMAMYPNIAKGSAGVGKGAKQGQKKSTKK